ncbi:MAG: aminotransferase class V-fold PLP-dependent enzyme [Alphaproteobacteria bacterium]|nr:aminotransferase class V-fold PLP-dependent enzyme [Alphaproteobacteria bacterium]
MSVYLDHNATWPVLPEVAALVGRWLSVPANPSSAHRAGQAAASAVEEARAQVAALVGADPAGVVFTSGATEALHLGLRGALARGGGLALTTVEHPAVHAVADAVEAEGRAVHRLPVDADGRWAGGALPAGVGVLAVQAANHETGVLQDPSVVHAAADAAGAWLLVDAAQAAGRVPVVASRADGVVLSAHKLGGPVGVGALVLRDPGPFPALFGGTQERGRRGGTVPTALVAGMGLAAALAAREREGRVRTWAARQERLEGALVALGGHVVGRGVPRLANTTLVTFDGLRGDTLVQALDLRGVQASAGAACASGSRLPSRTLRALGHPWPEGALRLSQGPGTTDDEVDRLLAVLPEVLRGVREAAAWEA